MSRRQQVLSSYRSLLRATRIAFDGDHRVFTAARQQVRQGYETGRNELTSEPQHLDEIDTRLEHASGVALLLRSNIVQGELLPRQASKETLSTSDDDSASETEGSVYKLRIHKHSELGDNDAVKGGRTNLAGTAKKIKWSN
ncbi:mitochondrial zinc maintenance protein 1, mitochondrial [Lipomyces kononenkoae]|uniref:Mitochondrial zinc maintenance protein 1, mitochondrial n=1 Tax=Lipomyces kononenkoae TaxID=34357 RepID=A0ACC3T7I5_LIPKO